MRSVLFDLVCAVASLSVLIQASSSSSASDQEQFFKLVLHDIKGNPIHFDQFRGKITLLVNTASQCSHTDSHMQSLKRLHDILSYGSVFNVVVFPCNDFGGQEPWEAQEIEEYYRGHFGVEFIILEKGIVEESPLWQWIKGQSRALPEWNFHKYLIDGEGQVLGDWDAEVSVESIFETVQGAIERQKEQQKIKKSSPSSTDTNEESESEVKISDGSGDEEVSVSDKQKEKDEL